MDFKQITFPNENINYISPSWDDMNVLAFEIAKKLQTDSEKNGKKTNQKIDRIITLAKGGWPMTRSLVDFTGINKVASIGVKFYSGINKRLDKPDIYQNLPVSVRGETVLLFDDVAETGESLKFVKAHLLNSGVKKVITATLFYKPKSVVKPDYYGAETTAWIIFPYEIRETSEQLIEKWGKEGLEREEIISRFGKLKFPKEWVEFYGK